MGKSRRIKLTKGKFAVIDEGDYERISRHKWYALKQGRKWYAACDSQPVDSSMHRFILKAPKGLEVDHKNGNGLDNRRSNIRLCTKRQNAQNRQRTRRGCASKYHGVRFVKNRSRWRAVICAGPLNKKGYAKQLYIGVFRTQLEAAKAYDKAARKYFGRFACPNFKERK